MTEKRFTIRKSMYIADGYVVVDNEHRYTFSILPKSKAINYCRILNLLNDENKELKQENEKLKQSYNIFCGKINNSISRLYRNRSITFDERAFYLRKVRELKEEIFE